MVKFLAVAAALAAVAAPVTAKNCVSGLYYCGKGLLAKGAYLDQIYASLINAGVPFTPEYIYRSLFFCQFGDKGEIYFIALCNGVCKIAGGGESDSCQAS
ncbi:hypothetical protein A9K55_005225 [Cordyceps militaris]|uniref:Uncharacterized protein n=1 Tax=Cordyceps militaris TaxID=73501 RepID=A0A2H4SP62_CORMI|nr:hypothetical protein A9K55_005225 [Cordyceps militaris]